MNGGPGLEALRSYLQPVTRSNSQPLASPEDAVTSLGGETGQVQKDAPKPGSEVVELRLQISRKTVFVSMKTRSYPSSGALPVPFEAGPDHK
jgi:hypothetical protein